VGIILGSSTAAAVADDMALIEIDLIRVRGKRAPDRIFALLGDGALASDATFRRLAAANAGMRSAHAAQDWAEVAARLDDMEALSADLDLGLDAYIALMRARLRVFVETPPPPGWDGVVDALSK
jgi:adenylate cyclase